MSKPLKKTLLAFVSVALAGGVLYERFPGLLVESGFRVLRWWGGLKRYEIQVDDHRWVYLEGGSGAPILFVHGFGADKDRWGAFLPAFTGRYRVVAPDLPGFGESSRIPSESYDIPSQVERLDRFVETIGLSSFHLLGISMGGYISAYYAAEHPEKVKSLALLDPAGVKAKTPSELMERYEREGRMPLVYETPQGYEELVRLIFYDPPWVPARILAYLAGDGIRNHDLHEKILREIAKEDASLLEGRLKNIKAKTLLIWGANDRIIDVSCVEEFQKGVKDIQTVILEECGHVPYIEKPKETKRAYKDFLKGASS